MVSTARTSGREPALCPWHGSVKQPVLRKVRRAESHCKCQGREATCTISVSAWLAQMAKRQSEVEMSQAREAGASIMFRPQRTHFVSPKALTLRPDEHSRRPEQIRICLSSEALHEGQGPNPPHGLFQLNPEN